MDNPEIYSHTTHIIHTQQMVAGTIRYPYV